MKILYLVSSVFCLSVSLCFALCLTAAVDNRVSNYFPVKQKFSGLRSATDICDFHSRLRKDTVKAYNFSALRCVVLKNRVFELRNRDFYFIASVTK